MTERERERERGDLCRENKTDRQVNRLLKSLSDMTEREREET